jgi:transcriptional regulator
LRAGAARGKERREEVAMHPNPSFRGGGDDRALALLRDRGFGTLAVNGAEGPLLSYVPLHPAADGGHLDLHLVRSNPILRALPTEAVAAVSGPDGYVSPDWYGVDDQVPTWNYVAVHVRGRLERRPDDEMRAMLDRQAEPYETRVNPDRPWTAAKMTPEVLRRMMRQIVPCRLIVDRIDATWKLSQNKPDAVRLRAADAIEAGDLGTDLATLAALMRQPEGPA